MSFWSNIFSWNKPKEQQSSPDKKIPNRPGQRDITEDLVANKDLTYGLFHNTYSGMKLAGPLAKTPILVPLWFMGAPTPKTNDEGTMELINQVFEQFYGQMKQIHLQCHREGTVWIFPKYSSKLMRLIWEFIPDESVVDVIKDIDTGEIIEIITDEQLTVAVGENVRAIVHRKRYFQKQKITVQWSGGSVPAELKDQSMRNPFGILPIQFSNNADGDEIRGHSDYSAILSDLKDYHDIDLKQSTVLAKFEPKLVVGVGDTVDKWLEDNGITDVGEFINLDLYRRDVFFKNNTQQETVEYVSIDNAYEAYESALKRKYRKIVEGTMVPEMLWGVKIEGNHASAEEQMNNVVQFIDDKREQKNDSYLKLFTASLQLLGMATMRATTPIIDSIEWNNLDALSDKVKAQILKDFSQGISYLVSKAGASLDMIYTLWKKFFPTVAPETVEMFKTGVNETAQLNQFASAPFELVAGMNGTLDDETGI